MKKFNPDSNEINTRSSFTLNDKTPFAVSEAYRSARTNLRFVCAPDECNIIAVTSSFPGEGKTLTCINLAISIAENNQKVLLIDSDMRKPQIASTLGLEKSPGLSELLAGMVKISTDDTCCRQKTKIKNLDVITAGKTPPNPSELLASDRMKRLLDKLSPEYDFIMIDTPPALVVTDALVLKPYISGYVMVVRSGHTKIEVIKETLNRYKQADAKICGIMLNAHRSKGGSYGKYSKYSHYGRKYGN